MTEPINIADQPSDKLIEILREGTPLHAESLLMEIEVELMERDVEYTIPFKKTKQGSRRASNGSNDLIESEQLEDQGIVFVPFLVGIVLLVTPIIFSMAITIPRSADPEHLLYFSIGFIVMQRIIVLGVIDNYNRKLKIGGGWWYVMGVIFGTWALLAYNISWWMKPKRVA